MTRAFSSLGRETFASNVTWVDGWPSIEPVELNEVLPAPVFIDDFNAEELSGEWLTIRLLASEFVMKKPGNIMLKGEGRKLDHEAPTFLGRRQRRLEGVVRATVSVSGIGGLTMRYDEAAHYDIEISGGQVVARAVLSYATQEVAVEAPYVESLTLLMKLDRPSGVDFPSMQTSDIVRLGYVAADGSEVIVASFDGRYLSAEVTCSFTGRVIGVYSVEGSLELLRYEEVAS
jgi:beta-xylosidase